MSRATTHITFDRTEIQEIAYILAVLETILAADDGPASAPLLVAGETRASMASWIGQVGVKSPQTPIYATMIAAHKKEMFPHIVS